MKIIEDSTNRLVLKEGAVTNRVAGVVILAVGVTMVILAIRSPKAMILYALGAVLIVAGGLMAFLVKSDTVVADKTSRQLSVTFKSLKNRDGQIKQCSFDDVQAVVLMQQYRQQNIGNNSMNNMNSGNGLQIGGMNSNTATTLQQTLVIQLKSGENMSIANESHQVVMGVGVHSNKLVGNGQKLAEAIGVPFQENGAGSITEAIDQARTAVTSQIESFTSPAANVPSPTTQPTDQPQPAQGPNQSPPQA